jgi:hypothetical protein
VSNSSTADTGRTATEKSATEARQGRYGRPVLYVLIGGLILCAIVLVLLGVSAPPPSIGASPSPVGQ